MQEMMPLNTVLDNSMLLMLSLVPLVLTVSCGGESKDRLSEQIITMERAALDRWGNGDPQGYLELYAPEATYFDPTQERRVDGLAAMTAYLTPITGQIQD